MIARHAVPQGAPVDREDHLGVGIDTAGIAAVLPPRGKRKGAFMKEAVQVLCLDDDRMYAGLAGAMLYGVASNRWLTMLFGVLLLVGLSSCRKNVPPDAPTVPGRQPAGEVLEPDEFAQLSEDERRRYEREMETLGEELRALLDRMPRIEQELRRKMKEVIRETLNTAVGHLLDDRRERGVPQRRVRDQGLLQGVGRPGRAPGGGEGAAAARLRAHALGRAGPGRASRKSWGRRRAAAGRRRAGRWSPCCRRRRSPGGRRSPRGPFPCRGTT